MTLFRITWYLSSGWKIEGQLYAPDELKAAEFAEQRLRSESPQWAGLGKPEVRPMFMPEIKTA